MIITLASAKGGVGKTTSAIHIAAILAADAPTLLIDGDPNRSSLKWSDRGSLPFKTVELMAAAMHSRNYQHLVFDTPARPNSEDLAALVEGCELLAIPTTPDILSIEATLETVAILEDLGCHHYKILLTIVPPGRKTGQQTREALEGYPMFSRQIRRYAAYEKAALEGVLVKDAKDRNAGIAWSDYERLGKELMA
ncbi:MAG: ParA family protein [Synechococcales cyanobacterium K32_A2020_035]|nr:ParA family protein [Synechococcales cyanobacterium K32_A2020_035]